MKLQEQCCTVEQGIRLVELGAPAASHFSHFKATSHAGICLSEIAIRHIAMLCGHFYDSEDVELTPAFNVAELGELLPKSDRTLSAWNTKSFRRSRGTTWEVSYNHHPGWYDHYATEAQARAALLIHLLEKNLITFKPDTATLAG